MEESGFAITSINGRINRAVWGPLNRTIVTDREDATIRIWDLEEAQEDEERERVCQKQGHQGEGDHGGVVDAEDLKFELHFHPTDTIIGCYFELHCHQKKIPDHLGFGLIRSNSTQQYSS
ncbi:hypothetical protein ZEAMMB73_Zm00001d007727 [Zea mays]|uniref:Uncharacterized protein n=1 Tax=Zea mays TaxID=4577 RepID=A0A1D6F8H5_MAIZE|nr:hypothetical protein ZEAMMB73_Zm00001d007727 [Zea mays]